MFLVDNLQNRITLVPMSTIPIVRTIREQITEQLRHEVLSGRLAEGEHLHEVKLAERFGVSRGPVRDALLQLTQEGMLVYTPNCGVEVASGVSERVRPLVVAIRRRIEVFALDIAFDEASEADIREWEKILEQLRIAGENDELAEVVRHDMAFHRWIVDRRGEPDLLPMWLPVVSRMRLGYSRHRDLRDVYPEHLKIVRAFRKGNRKAACKAVEANIV
jgi:DNA-binding GntR family transcriptional regulator